MSEQIAPPQPPPASIDAAATTLLSEVTPALAQLSGRVESLQQQQAALRQSLQGCALVDEAAIAKVDAAISQVRIGAAAAKAHSIPRRLSRAPPLVRGVSHPFPHVHPPQIPAYHTKLETLQGDMLDLATRTASMRQRSDSLKSQVNARDFTNVSCRLCNTAVPSPRAQVVDS